jgi:hypothetical protein
MIVNGDAQGAGGLDNRLRHVDVGARGRGVSRRMVVDQNSQRNKSLFISVLCTLADELGYGFGV